MSESSPLLLKRFRYKDKLGVVEEDMTEEQANVLVNKGVSVYRRLVYADGRVTWKLMGV